MNKAVLFSKASDEWSTPRDLFDKLHAEFQFTTDAACTPKNGLPVRQQIYSALDNDWSDDGNYEGQCVFLNPPYSSCYEFIHKASLESGRGATVVCLVPSRTDTRWWHELVWNSSRHKPRKGVEVRFIKGRLKFGNSENSAPFPSVIVIFRPPA